MLRPLDPLGVYERWDWMRAGIQKAIERTDAHMRPEDAYVRLRNGTAWAYVIGVQSDDIGFLILTQEHDPDGLVLFVWCLWCKPHSLAPVQVQLYTELDDLARKAGAKRIRWQSPRAYGRWGKQVAHIYEREVVI